MNHELDSVSLADWKTYLRWHVIHENAPALPEKFVQENFDFYDRKLSGTKEILPPWKRCVQSAGPGLRRKIFSSCGQSARERNGEQFNCGATRRYSHAVVDGAGDQEGRR
jgi:hypothetical protein